MGLNRFDDGTGIPVIFWDNSRARQKDIDKSQVMHRCSICKQSWNEQLMYFSWTLYDWVCQECGTDFILQGGGKKV